jgi:hypothetical protein
MPGRPIAWCGPDDSYPGTVLHVAAIGGVQRAPAEGYFSYWHLWALPRDVEDGQRVHFPGRYKRDAILFAYDELTENEASTQEENSSGSAQFTTARCKVGAPLAFAVEGVIGSEFGTSVEPITVTGAWEGVLSAPPPGWAR